MYDFLLVGAGMFNAVLAYELQKKGKRCIVVEKRDHIGGNCYTEDWDGINVHKYGAHIFRTNEKHIWQYINQFAEFNNFINSPMAVYKNEIYNLPFNMNTFSRMWDIRTPQEALAIIKRQSKEISRPATNLEDHAIALVGTDIYEKLIKGYTKKQWGRDCKELPASIMKRIPLRFIYDNNYYSDLYQGIPIGGYTRIFDKMFSGCDICLEENYLQNRSKYEGIANHIVFTGTIDSFFDYCYGSLEYRSLRFETERMNISNYQGNAVINYTDYSIPYTRIIEHKHFEFGKQDFTVVTREFPLLWDKGIEPYYPINDEKNTIKYGKYMCLAEKEKIIFGGRLGMYQYFDMQDTIKAALKLAKEID